LCDDIKSFTAEKMKAVALLPDEDAETNYASALALAIYPIDHPYVAKLVANGGNRADGRRDWFIFSGAQADPFVNRFACGYLLWRANLYGAMVSDYQTNISNDYLDDTQNIPNANQATRPQMMTYPVQGGSLSTLDWEACREGVTDVSYWTTFYGALRECKDAKVAKAITANAEAWVNKFFSRPIASVTDEDIQNSRLTIAHYTIEMQEALAKHFGRKK
jgi:hypothetical protein